MTQNEIIEMAKQVGYPIRHPEWQKATEEFAALVEEKVAAKERKEICGTIQQIVPITSWAHELLEAIRARGEQT